MTSIVRIALVAAGLSALAPSTTFAASATTDAFVANVRPRLDFLDPTSRLALDETRSPKLRAFARDEANEQALAGIDLAAWSATARTSVAAQAPAATGVDDLLTGRSVAIDAATGEAVNVVARTPAPGTLLPSQDAGLSRLSATTGRRFDALYVSTQTATLRQLVTLYADYARDGDDPALRAMAARQLPIVTRRLTQVRGL